MRVLAMTSLFPNPYQPHKWSPNYQQLRLMAEKIPVDVIAPIPWTVERAGRKEQGSLFQEGRCRRLNNLDVEHPKYWYPPGIMRSSYGYWYRWSVRKVFEKHVHEFQPDIIFTHWAYPDGWAAVKLGHAAGLPVVLQAMGSDVLLMHEHRGRQAGTRQALAEADGIWAVSQDLANHVQGMGIPQNRICVIYDGVDPAIFYPGDQRHARQRLDLDITRKIILFVGNLAAVKGVDRLILACQQLHEDGVDFQAAIIGQGELRQHLESQLAGQSCRDRVKFYGSIPQDRLPDWYRAADVFVLPSYSEGVPNVLLEASACGLPYVASDVGGIPEIAHRGHGTLATPGNVQAFANAIRETLSKSKPSPPSVRIREACIEEFLVYLNEVRDRFRSYPATIRRVGT